MVLDLLGAIVDVVEHPAQFAAVQFMNTPLLPAPTPTAEPIPGMEPVANMFIGWLKWVLIVGGVVGLLICAIMMAVGRRGRSSLAADGAAGIPWVLGGLALGSIAFIVVSTVLPG